ncbi:hypothetical protein CMI38_04160 [Candidatus Pacearchaeota archaeon]|nr:hypothetical protein [Candidatus Pacearchaeota archaeon]|tara:strand:+ start:334 stop:714 length:381 start_codon:yes stop_codon:yes gene_type:complete
MGTITNQVVLDTDCLIQLEKGDLSIINSLNETGELFITSITVFEFALGDSFDNNQERLEDYSVVSFSKEDGILAAKILKKLKKQGMEIEFRDVMIASICINKNIPLLTNNKRHFERLREEGLKLST